MKKYILLSFALLFGCSNYSQAVGVDCFELYQADKSSENYNCALKKELVNANGNSHSMVNLAYLYSEKEDFNNQIKWLKKATKLNNEVAAYRLAHFYYSGMHVNKNLEAALRLLEFSASKGFSEAMLEFSYLHGEILEIKNFDVALKYLTLLGKKKPNRTDEQLVIKKARILLAKIYKFGMWGQSVDEEKYRYWVKASSMNQWGQ